MHWKAKAHALALLSRLPGGRRLYHLLQRLAGTNRLDIRRDLDRAFEIVELIVAGGAPLRGAVVVEIGTGWRPVVPMVLALAGAKRIITLDINPWLTPAYAHQTWHALSRYCGEIADRCGCERSDVERRFHAVPTSARTLETILPPLGIDYRCPADARSTGLAPATVDLVVSSNVLEHIPADVQREIHRESLRVLRPGGLAVHRFNPQDHFATVDPTITHGNFLQFSARQWHWYGGSGLAYHNRLRAPDYRELFEQAGFETVYDRQRVDERTLRAIHSGALPVHPEFAGYAPQELAVDYMWLVCRKPLTVGSEHFSSTPAGSWRHEPQSSHIT